MSINMKRILGHSRLAIQNEFRQWCTPDRTMVVPVESLSVNTSVEVRLDGITAIVFDCDGHYWRAGYVNGPGIYTVRDMFPKRCWGDIMWDSWKPRTFNLYQMNSGLRDRIEFLRNPNDISPKEFERTRMMLYILLCHTEELELLRRIEIAYLSTSKYFAAACADHCCTGEELISKVRSQYMFHEPFPAVHILVSTAVDAIRGLSCELNVS